MQCTVDAGNVPDRSVKGALSTGQGSNSTSRTRIVCCKRAKLQRPPQTRFESIKASNRHHRKHCKISHRCISHGKDEPYFEGGTYPSKTIIRVQHNARRYYRLERGKREAMGDCQK